MTHSFPTRRSSDLLIEQVLVNLLDNAAKYSPQRSRITISARLQDNTVIAQVCDQGAGIPADAQEAVFDVFYRLRAGDRETAGSGLGLSIRSEEHTSELQSLMRISYAVFCLKKKTYHIQIITKNTYNK